MKNKIYYFISYTIYAISIYLCMHKNGFGYGSIDGYIFSILFFYAVIGIILAIKFKIYRILLWINIFFSVIIILICIFLRGPLHW